MLVVYTSQIETYKQIIVTSGTEVKVNQPIIIDCSQLMPCTHSLGSQKAKALRIFHAVTECDSVLEGSHGAIQSTQTFVYMKSGNICCGFVEHIPFPDRKSTRMTNSESMLTSCIGNMQELCSSWGTWFVPPVLGGQMLDVYRDVLVGPWVRFCPSTIKFNCF
jgi:hypothetical protein